MAKTRLQIQKNNSSENFTKVNIKSKEFHHYKNIENECKVELIKLSSKVIAKLTGKNKKSEPKSTDNENQRHYELRKRKKDLVKTIISTDYPKEQDSMIRNVSNSVNSTNEKYPNKNKEYERKEVTFKTDIRKNDSDNITQEKLKVNENQMLFKRTRQHKNKK